MRLRLQIVLGLLLMPFALSWNAAAQSTDSATSQKDEASGKPSAAAVTPATTDQEYYIGPQDVVQIDVWKEPEITRTIPVRPDGKISLPLLNDVQAAGLTAMQLAGRIREGLTKYLNNPQVTVTVTLINSRRVFVTGEVARSGVLPLLPSMTVLQALSAAGGLTQFAREKKIYIVRTVDGKQVSYPFDYKGALSGKHPETNILLQAGDMIVVP